MSTPDFRNLLSKKVEETERPKPEPVGTYVALIKGHEFGTSRQKQTPYVRFNLTPMSPMDDVDQEQLAEFGGLEKLATKSKRLDFYLTDDAMWRLREFLEEHLGMNSSGRSYESMIPETTNMQVLIHIAHRISDDGKNTFAEIDSVAAVQ